MPPVAQNHPFMIKEKQIMMIMQTSNQGPSAAMRKPPLPTTTVSAAARSLQQEEQVKLASLAVSFNIRLRSADMPSAMQERALRHARALLDSSAAPNPTLLARSLKKEFDSVYGPAWHCVAGKSFGSFVTHSPGGFVYFSVDSLSFLLFKTQVHVVVAQPSSPKP